MIKTWVRTGQGYQERRAKQVSGNDFLFRKHHLHCAVISLLGLGNGLGAAFSENYELSCCWLWWTLWKRIGVMDFNVGRQWRQICYHNNSWFIMSRYQKHYCHCCITTLLVLVLGLAMWLIMYVLNHKHTMFFSTGIQMLLAYIAHSTTKRRYNSHRAMMLLMDKAKYWRGHSHPWVLQMFWWHFCIGTLVTISHVYDLQLQICIVYSQND